MLTPLGLLLLALLFGLPIGWLVSEFRGGRVLRIGLGVLALGFCSFCIWTLVSITKTFNYNAWYGGATGDLISTSVREIDEGHFDRVLVVWRSLDRQYHPTYENRAHYRELVEEATRRMRGEVPIEKGSAWDASPFTSETWVGHWEDDNGYWIVINDLRKPFDILRSGDPPTEMESVSATPDFTVVKFKEGTEWLHTLTLKNKYEATHEWFDLEKGSVWKTDTMHKLIRASEAQKRMTQVGSTKVSERDGSETNRTTGNTGSGP